METVIKKVTDDIYHLFIAEYVCNWTCGANLLSLITTHDIPHHSFLILETHCKVCNMRCDQELLKGCHYFDAVAYVVQQETANFYPLTHAEFIRNSHQNTCYFDIYQDGFNWLNIVSQQTIKKYVILFNELKYSAEGISK